MTIDTTYIKVSFINGQQHMEETPLGQTLRQVVEHIEDDLYRVLMIDGGKVMDVSVDAAELWLALNAGDIDTRWDVPTFVLQELPDEIEMLIGGRRNYEHALDREHERSCRGQ